MRLIDADALAVRTMFSEDGEYSMDYVPVFAIREAPTVEAVLVRRGKWHTLQETKLTKTVECTRCNFPVRFRKEKDLNIDQMPYCPACGAEMEVKRRDLFRLMQEVARGDER